MNATEERERTASEGEQVAPSDELIERIKKALALARDKGATGGEAAAAMEAVSRMLLKYNLELADIEAGGEGGDGAGGIEIGENSLDIGAVEWRWTLAKAIIEHNFCKPFEYRYGRNGKVSSCTVLGSPANVEAVVLLTDWLFRQVEGQARESWRERTPEGHYDRWRGLWLHKSPRGAERIVVMPRGWTYIAPRTWYQSFSIGAAYRLVERLAELRRAQVSEEAAGSITALTVSVDTAIRDYIERKHPWRKEQRLAVERRETEAREKAEALAQWRAEHPEEALALDLADKAERDRRAAEWDAEWERKQKARAAYEERYYREHGWYPGDRRGRGRYVPDTTNYTAYDAGMARAERISLSPYIGAGEKATALP
jgi:hypothetical protein